MAELTVQTHSHLGIGGAEEKGTEKGKVRLAKVLCEFGHDPTICLGEELICVNVYRWTDVAYLTTAYSSYKTERFPGHLQA